METPEGLPPLPAAERIPAVTAPRDLSDDEDHALDDEPAATDDAPAQLPSPAQLGFMANLLLFLAAPVRAFERVHDAPVRVGVRFGFLAAFAGIMGTSLKTWVRGIPTGYGDLSTGLPSTVSATCIAEQLSAWDTAVHPYLLARIPVSPVLALMLLYGLGHLFHLMATAMTDALDVDMPTVTRNIGFAFAPMALGAIFPFGMCFVWSLFLCVLALRQAFKFPWWLCMSMASVPFWMWMAVEFLVSARILMPCMQVTM